MAESDPNVQKLGLDASGVEQEIDSIVLPAFARLNRQTNEIVKVFDEASSHMSSAAEQFGEVESQASVMARVFQTVRNTSANLFSQISSGNTYLRESVRFWGDAERAIQEYRQAVERTEIAERRFRQQPYGDGPSRTVTRAGEPLGRNKIAETDVAARAGQIQLQTEKEIEVVTARVEANRRRMIRDANDLEDRLMAQVRTQKELDAQIEQAKNLAIQEAETRNREFEQAIQFEQDWAAGQQRQAQIQAAEDQRREASLRRQRDLFAQLRAEYEAGLRKEQEAAARRVGADQVGGTLLSRFQVLNPATASQISTAVGAITKAVNDGAVSSERALQIFTSVERGEAQAFEAAEARVANASRRILTLFGSSGFQGSGGGGGGKGKSKGGEEDEEGKRLSGLILLQNRYADAVKKAGDAGKEAGQKIFLSWNQVARLFVLQSLHQLVYRFFSALKETTQATMEFEIRISEIRTISQSAQQTTEQWSRQIRQLSSEFGNPALDVAEAAYQTLSNQIAHGAEVTEFLRKALEFGKITVSSAKDAVNLLSSALNSFHMAADQTDHVAATLFKTIELGRVRAEEMAGSFGRLGALAFPLGVSLEEVGAAVATLGRQGIAYDEVQTLLSNVLLRLLKPSKEMQERLDKWGVSTGVAAVQTYGFVGVLRKLQEETKGSADEIADLFKNLRSTEAALGITGDSFAGLESDLQRIQNESRKTADAAKEISMESPAAQLKKQFESLKNYFESSWGEFILKAVNDLTHALSDEGLVGAIRESLKVATIAAAAWTAYRLYLEGAARASKIFAAVEDARRQVALGVANSTKLEAYALTELDAGIALNTQAAEENSLIQEHRIEQEARLTVALNAQYAAVLEMREANIALITSSTEEAVAQERVTLAEANLVATEKEVIASTAALAADAEITTAAIEAQAVAHIENAEAAHAAAVAQNEVTTSSLLMGGALKSIIGLATNPLTWIVAAIAFITYEVEKSYEAAHAAEKAFKSAQEAAERAAAEINRVVEGALADQERAFKESLNRDFQAYGQFSAGVGRLIQGTVEYHKEQLREAADATKESIRENIQAYEDGTKRVEEVEKRSLDNIHHLEEDEDKSRQDFADREFERQMKLAEYKDQQATPGGKDQKLFDQNQLKLIQDHIQQLQQANAELQNRSSALTTSGTPAIDPRRQIELKQIQDNFNLQQKNVKEIEKLEDDLFNRRISLQKQASKTTQDLAEAEARQKAHLAEEDEKKRQEAISDEKREIDQGFARRRPARGIGRKEQREEDVDLKNQEEEARRRAEALRQAEQTREDAKRVDELRARQAAEAASLQALPELNKFSSEFGRIQEQNNKLLEDQKKLQQEIADQAHREVEARKAGFGALRTVLEEIAKFKLDQPKIVNREDLDKRLQDFDLLMQKAQQAGLTDQQILNKWVQERIEMELNGQALIAASEHKHLQERAQVARSQIEREEAERKAAIEQIRKGVTELYPIMGGLLGTQKDKEFVPGAIETGIKAHIVEGIGNYANQAENRAEAAKAIEQTKKVAEDLQNIQKAESDLATKGTPFDPKIIEKYKEDLEALKNLLKEQYDPFIKGNLFASHGTVYTRDPMGWITSRPKDAQGRDLTPNNLGAEFNRLAKFGDILEKRIQSEAAAVGTAQTQQKAREADLKRLQDQSDALAKQYGLLDDSVSKTNKSFADLSAELTNIVTGMQRLKLVIDSLQPPPNAPPIEHKALGGMIFAPRGTDTIPAMLTPGEFVMNAAATRQHYGQLLRMNLYRQDGGIVPNYTPSMPQMPELKASTGNTTNFNGDFHYHGKETGDLKQQAKEMAQVFKEEVRRGTIPKFWADSRTS